MSNLEKQIGSLHSAAHLEIVTLRAEHPQKPDLVNQLDRALANIFKAISLVAAEVEKLKAK